MVSDGIFLLHAFRSGFPSNFIYLPHMMPSTHNSSLMLSLVIHKVPGEEEKL
jgi:hypothetical protein